MFLSWGLLIISVLFNVFGAFVIKVRLNEMGPIKVDSIKILLNSFLFLVKSPVVVVGLILFFAAPFLFAISLSRMEISIAYPVSVGLNFLILIILGFAVLGEQVTFYKMMGIICVGVGILFLYKSG